MEIRNGVGQSTHFIEVTNNENNSFWDALISQMCKNNTKGSDNALYSLSALKFKKEFCIYDFIES